TPITAELTGRGKAVAKVNLRVGFDKAAAKIPQLNWSKPKGAAGDLALALDLGTPNILALREIKARASDLDIRGDVVLTHDGTLVAAKLDPLRAGPGTNAKIAADRQIGKPRDKVVVSITGPALDIGNLVTDARKDLQTSSNDPAKPDIELNAAITRLSL